MKDPLEELKRSLEECPIVDKGGYKYFVHPITDGIPHLDPNMLASIAEEIARRTDGLEFDYIIGAEAMAIPLGVALSLMTDKPFIVIRKRSYGLPGEVEVEQETGYSKNRLYINALNKGDRVLVVDDVVSTGGTLKALVKTLDNMGVNIVDIMVVIEKGDIKDKLSKEIGHDIHTLVKVHVMEDGRLKVVE